VLDRTLSACIGFVMVLTSWSSLADPYCPPNPDNVALGKSYELTPAPNYDHPDPDIDNQVGDDVDLTDGCFVQASHGDEASVTWYAWPKARVEIDLEAPGCASDPLSCHAISEIRFQVRDQKGLAGVYCPREATFSVSDDGVDYHPVGTWTRPADYPEVDCAPEGPDFGGRNFMISSGALKTRGAFARVEITGDRSFIFIDEVEVQQGSDPTQTNYQDGDFEEQLDALGPDWRIFVDAPWRVAGPTTLPEAGSPDASLLEFALARGETGSASLLITNPYASSTQIDASVSEFAGPDGWTLPAAIAEVRHAAPAPTIVFDQRADALFSMATQPAPTPTRRVTHLWIDLTVPRTARAGRYEADLVVSCDGTPCGESKTIRISLEVQPFTLPVIRDLKATYFDWSFSIPEAEGYIPGALAPERAVIRERYGMNAHVTYLTPLPPWSGGEPQPPDFGVLGDALDRHEFKRTHLIYLAGGNNWRRNFSGNACYPSQGWRIAYAFWITQIRDYLLGRGLGYDRFAIYPIDEPSVGRALTAGAGCPDPMSDRMDFYLDAATIIRMVDPAIRVMINSGGTDVGVLQDLADQQLAQVWVPHYQVYFDNPELASFYASRIAAGELVWLYNGPRFRQGHGEPYAEGRLVPWTIYDAGLQGYGYWAMFAPSRAIGGSDPLSLWNPLAGSGAPYATIYLSETWDDDTPPGLATDDGVVPSRRLAAFRRGIDDLRGLLLLGDLIDLRDGIPECADEVSAARGVRDTAAAAVLVDPEDQSLADAQTAAIAESIVSLSPPEGVTLRVESTPGTRLVWTDRGPDVLYDVAGGLLTALRASGGFEAATCLADDVVGVLWDDVRPEPAAGDGYYYLVRPQNDCAVGSFGAAGSGDERDLSTRCP
jgi:hypothetical protein